MPDINPRGPLAMPSRRPARRPRTWLFAVPAAMVAVGLSWSVWTLDRPRRLQAKAEAATRLGDWPSALAAWRAFNQSHASPPTYLQEARAALASDRGLDATRALERATEADPRLAEAWRARLDRLRVLDRPLEAMEMGLAAARTVNPGDRRAILASATLAVLAELPDDQARDRLDRWIKADPDDVDARVARLVRDPGTGRVAELSGLLTRHPDHIPAREALVAALGDLGEFDRGRGFLESWPADARDARYDRLEGRWAIDHDHRPDLAALAFARCLVAMPSDWKSRYGLARSLRALGHDAEARQEAEAVARVRDRLDPKTLGPRLAADLARPADDARGAADLAELCRSVGLDRLADAWRPGAER